MLLSNALSANSHGAPRQPIRSIASSARLPCESRSHLRTNRDAPCERGVRKRWRIEWFAVICDFRGPRLILADRARCPARMEGGGRRIDRHQIPGEGG